MKLSLPTMYKFIFSCLILSVNVNIYAKEARTYSTEGYCILAFEQVNHDYLKEYESRLGFRPKVKLCNRVNRLIVEFQPKSWIYQFGQPYPGSSIYLNPEQVEKIIEARGKNKKRRR
jgi:hypothetical protein